MTIPAALLPRLRAIRLFLCDVDGVLTDGSVLMGAGGLELKRFDIRDGFGLKLLQHEGLKVGWVSARPSSATTERAKDLKVDFLVQSPAPKVESIGALLTQNGFTWEATAYAGDDIIDLGALGRAGFAAAPADARPEAQAAAHYVCSSCGGRGAVRELVELLLRAQGRWEAVVARFAALGSSDHVPPRTILGP